VLSSSRFYSSAPFFSFFERSSLNWHHILVDSNNLQGYPKARKNQREIREKPSGKKKARLAQGGSHSSLRSALAPANAHSCASSLIKEHTCWEEFCLSLKILSLRSRHMFQHARMKRELHQLHSHGPSPLNKFPPKLQPC
jgi:hypothetical protein